MTSRERVLRAVNHETPDRVPIDLGATKASGIAVVAYEKLKHTLGISTPTKVLDSRFMIAAVEEEILRRLHVDVVPLDLTMLVNMDRPDSEWIPRRLFNGMEPLFPPGTKIAEDASGDWILLAADGSPTSFRMPKGGYYFDDMSCNAGGHIEPEKFRPVSDIADEHLELMARYGRSLYETTDYAILGWGFGICFLGLSLITDRASNVTQGLPNEWMMMLMSEKETCHAMMDRSVEAAIKCLGLVKQAVGDYCFAWGIAADDSGTQRGEFIRPELWAEMLKPHYKKLCDWIHANTNWKVFLTFLRLSLPPLAAFRRGGHRHPQSRADLGRQHGPGAAEVRIRRPAGLLGRRLRHAERPGLRHAGGNPPARPPADCHLLAPRRLCLQPDSQHPSQRPAGEHPRRVRRSVRGLNEGRKRSELAIPHQLQSYFDSRSIIHVEQ